MLELLCGFESVDEARWSFRFGVILNTFCCYVPLSDSHTFRRQRSPTCMFWTNKFDHWVQVPLVLLKLDVHNQKFLQRRFNFSECFATSLLFLSEP